MVEVLIGTTLLGEYRVDAFIASGGMGAVYQVWDLKRNVPLAMKVLHADLAEDPSMLKRFRREANALKKLTHPNIVPFYGVHQTEGFVFLLEGYIDGPSLKETLREKRGRPLEVGEALSYLKALSAALGYAHAHGVVHCDIKPGNVMVDQGGSIYLTDFGIARYAESTTTTLAGAGTAGYMAPEQIRGEAVSAATDVYALGVMLYEMLAGRRPFRGDEKGTESAGPTANERTRFGHLHLDPPDPRMVNPAIPEGLAQVVLRALAKDPLKRYTSTQEMYLVACAEAGVSPAAVAERVSLSLHSLEPSWQQTSAGARTYPKRGVSDQFRGKGWIIASMGGLLVVLLLVLGAMNARSSPAKPVVSLPVSQTAGRLAAAGITATPSAVESTSTPTQVSTSTPEDTPTPTVSPTLTPDNQSGLIAFNSNRSGNNDIYLMDADGSHVTQLTMGVYDDRIPSWSPDGKMIAYQSNDGGDYEIMVVNLENRLIRQVTNNSCGDFNPVWSPDGTRFVFYSDCDGNREIYTAGVDGSRRQQLTQTSDVYNWFPNWSPDGRQIMFVSNRGGKYQVWIMSADGLDAHPIAYGCMGAFSPDGNWIVFAQYCTGTGRLYLVRSDGSDLRTLVEEENCTNPTWSSDGGKIIFQSDRTGNDDVWMINMDGTNLEQITFDSAHDAAPVWQPGN